MIFTEAIYTDAQQDIYINHGGVSGVSTALKSFIPSADLLEKRFKQNIQLIN